MRLALIVFIVLLHSDFGVFGQNTSGDNNRISLLEAIQLAEKSYPLLKSKMYEAEAARKNVDLTKNSIVPSLDITYQADLATYNNITGMLYATGIVPMTGPVASANLYNPVFGSAASLLLNWQPITFGQRNAQINVSKALAVNRAAESENEIFKFKISVISSYLDLALAYELVKVAEENLERTHFDLGQSQVLTAAGLRPGVDTALFNSELSKARIAVMNARRNIQTQKINLSELLVSDTAWMPTDTIFFHKLPHLSSWNDSVPSLHPLLQVYQSQLDFSISQENLLKKTWLPKLTFWGTTYARGSGVYPDGTIKSIDGFGFSRYNYGLGLQLAFPLTKFSEIHIQQQQQNLITKSEEQKLKQTVLRLSKDQMISDVTLQNAIAIAGEIPIQLQSAEYAFNSLQIRYHTGLVDFAEMIQAQYSLVKAQADLKTSHWETWKALLYKAAVAGEFNIFLNEMK